MCVFCVFLTRSSLFVTGLVILCMYVILIVVWVSVPAQAIAWKDSSSNVSSSGTLNSTHCYTHYSLLILSRDYRAVRITHCMRLIINQNLIYNTVIIFQSKTVRSQGQDEWGGA